MGTVCSTFDDEDAFQKSKLIDDQIKEDWKETQKKDEKTMLILGCAECGKSTIMNQMKFIYGKGLTKSEMKKYSVAIQNNVIDSIRNVIVAQRNLEIPVSEKKIEGAKERIMAATNLNISPNVIATVSETKKNSFRRFHYSRHKRCLER